MLGTKITNQSVFSFESCIVYSGMDCILYDGMSPVLSAVAVRHHFKNRKIHSKKVVYFAPESGVYYSPDSIVYFTPEYSFGEIYFFGWHLYLYSYNYLYFQYLDVLQVSLININMRILKSEKEFVIELEKYFSRIKDSLIWLEIPNMGQSVDMVVKNGKKLILIEVKLKNWVRAIVQCKAHQLVADYIYIALATSYISKEFYIKVSELGYGILHFNKYTNCTYEYLKPKKNKNFWKPQRNIFEEKLLNLHNYEFAPLDVI
jgi:hypothetical protein